MKYILLLVICKRYIYIHNFNTLFINNSSIIYIHYSLCSPTPAGYGICLLSPITCVTEPLHSCWA